MLFARGSHTFLEYSDTAHLWGNDHHEEGKHEEEHDQLQLGHIPPDSHPAAGHTHLSP